MNDEFERKLAGIFNLDKAKRDEADRREMARLQVRGEYLSLFRQKADEVFKPGFADFASSILQYGWSGQVEAETEGHRYQSQPATESVALIFSTSKGGLKTPVSAKGPTFRVVCEPDKGEIYFHGITTNTSGQIASKNRQLDLITVEQVQTMLLNFFSGLVAEVSPR